MLGQHLKRKVIGVENVLPFAGRDRKRPKRSLVFEQLGIGLEKRKHLAGVLQISGGLEEKGRFLY